MLLIIGFVVDFFSNLLVRLNEKLAWHLELDPEKLATPEGVEILAGNRMPKTR